ncbi:unnamed protein product, partial [Didymodactylos carnosus]
AVVCVSRPSPSLSPTTVLRNALRTMRPPIIEQPAPKIMVLNRQFVQSTKVISTPISSTPKCSVNRRRKTTIQLSDSDDLMTITDTPLTLTAINGLITSATAISTSSTLTTVIITNPITIAYASLVNLPQSSQNEIQFSFASFDARNNVPG